MTTPDDWSHPEIVRNLKQLTGAVRDLVVEVRRLDEKYVPREVQRLRDIHVDQRLDDLGKAVVDVEADQERHRRDHASTWSRWAIPIVTGVTVAAIAVLLTKLIGG